jgi:hypothetical protein
VGLFAVKVPALAAFAEDAEGGWGDLVLAPAPGEPVVAKQYASAFFATSLAATLHAAGVDTVVVAGVSTSGCIRATRDRRAGHGFRPHVVRQACADRPPSCTSEPRATSTPSTPTSTTSPRRWRTCERVTASRGARRNQSRCAGAETRNASPT